MTTTTEQHTTDEAIAQAAKFEGFHWAILTDNGGDAAVIIGNRWGGMDFFQSNGTLIRVTPIEGEPDFDACGFDVHHLNRASVLIASMRYSGLVTPQRVARLVNAFATE